MIRSQKFLTAGVVFGLTWLAGCSSAPKTKPEISRLLGKRVALVEVQGEDTARRSVEVALVNQLSRDGSFILVSKQDWDAAKRSADTAAADWKSWAEAAKADWGLEVRVHEFRAEETEGYDREEVTDSQLAEERGDSGKDSRLVKVKSLNAAVDLELTFTEVKTGDVRTARIQESRAHRQEASKTAIRMPPRLRVLEELTQKAVTEFFEKYR